MSLSRVMALTRSDLKVAARDGEQLLLTIALPLLFLVFFSQVDVLPTNPNTAGGGAVGSTEPIDFVAPGIVVLGLLSVAFVRTAIALGFDRSFGAIKRYAVTPLRVDEFLLAKLAATAAVMVVQLILIVVVAAGLGWRPTVSPAVPALLLLGLVVFLALGITLSSVIDGLTALAVANTLYLLLLLLSGLVFDLGVLPQWLQILANSLPSTALVSLLRNQLAPTLFGSPGSTPWLVLAAWTVTAVAAAWRLFRWH